MPFTGRAHPVQGAEVAKGIVDYGNELGIQTEGKRRTMLTSGVSAPWEPLFPHSSHSLLPLTSTIS